MSNRKPEIQDPVSAMIREQDVRITAVHAIKDANLLLVMLNEGRLEFPLDSFTRLAKASQAQLNKYNRIPKQARPFPGGGEQGEPVLQAGREEALVLNPRCPPTRASFLRSCVHAWIDGCKKARAKEARASEGRL